MKRSGFTLIELTLVLSVIAIAAGLVVVRVGGWSSRQCLRSSAMALGNTIRTWRDRARTDELVYVLVLQGRSYKVMAEGDLLREGSLGRGETFEPTNPKAITFPPAGVLPERRLTIRNALGEEITLVIHSWVNEIDYFEAP